MVAPFRVCPRLLPAAVTLLQLRTLGAQAGAGQQFVQTGHW